MTDARASWSNPKVLTTLLLVFLAGFFTGAFGMRFGMHEWLHRSNSSGFSKANKDVLLDKCKKELNLTPEQAREMAGILDDYAVYYQSLQDQLADMRATGKSRIMQLLNDDQKGKFEHMLTEMQRTGQ